MAVESETPLHNEDESYFVSMTDLMVGMLFIFIIMLMAFALSLRTQQEAFETTNEALTQANETREQMLKEIRRAMQRLGVQVEIDTTNGVLRLPEQLLFARGEFRVRESGQDALAKLAHVLSNVLPCYSASTVGAPANCPASKGGRLEAVFIEGHTDNVPIQGRMASGIENNWQLSTARAIETYKGLVESAPLVGLLDNDAGQRLLGVSGYAENRPVLSEDTEEARTANRRIDLRFLMATPSEEELRRIRQEIDQGLTKP